MILLSSLLKETHWLGLRVLGAIEISSTSYQLCDHCWPPPFNICHVSETECFHSSKPRQDVRSFKNFRDHLVQFLHFIGGEIWPRTEVSRQMANREVGDHFNCMDNLTV